MSTQTAAALIASPCPTCRESSSLMGIVSLGWDPNVAEVEFFCQQCDLEGRFDKVTWTAPVLLTALPPAQRDALVGHLRLVLADLGAIL